MKRFFKILKAKKKVKKLELSVTGCGMNFIYGDWTLDDKIAVKMYTDFQRKLEIAKKELNILLNK